MRVDSEHSHPVKPLFSELPYSRSLLNDFKQIERRDSMEPGINYVMNNPMPGRTFYSSGELDNQSTVAIFSKENVLPFEPNAEANRKRVLLEDRADTREQRAVRLRPQQRSEVSNL